MPSFTYTAKNLKGETIKGSYEAGSRNDVVGMLRQRAFFPLSIEAVTESKDVSELSFLNKVTTKNIAIFCKQFAILLGAGLPLIQILEILSKQGTNRKLRLDLAAITEDVRKGKSLASAFKARDNFPSLITNMIEVGEAGGSLEIVLQSISDHYEKETKLQQKAKSAMTYPIVVFFVTLGVVYFLLAFVVPMFVGIFQGSGLELPLPTRLLLQMSAFTVDYGLFVFSALVVIMILMRYYVSKEEGKLLWHSMQFKLPLIKKLVTLVVSLRFTSTMSILLCTGVPVADALELTGRVLTNALAQKAMKTVSDNIKLGNPMWLSLEQTKLFPSLVVHMTRIGEESGTLDEVLEKTATFYEDETETFLVTLTTLIEPAMILVLGWIVAFVVLSIAMPMFEMMGTIS